MTPSGTGTDRTPGRRCAAYLTLAVLVLPLAGGSAYGSDYVVRELQPFPDELSSFGYAINNYGHIVGEWTPTGGGPIHGFYYDGQKHDLGPDVHPRDISDNDLVTGHYTSGSAFLYDRTTDTFEGLGTLGGPTSEGVAINSLGGWLGFLIGRQDRLTHFSLRTVS